MLFVRSTNSGKTRSVFRPSGRGPRDKIARPRGFGAPSGGQMQRVHTGLPQLGRQRLPQAEEQPVDRLFRRSPQPVEEILLRLPGESEAAHSLFHPAHKVPRGKLAGLPCRGHHRAKAIPPRELRKAVREDLPRPRQSGFIAAASAPPQIPSVS